MIRNISCSKFLKHQYLTILIPKTKSLRITHLTIHSSIQSPTVLKLLNRSPRLISFKVSFTSGSCRSGAKWMRNALGPIIQGKRKNLKELGFYLTYNIKSIEEIFSLIIIIGNQCPNIDSLIINGITIANKYFKKIACSFKNLIKLHLHTIDHKNMLTILSTFPKLKSLSETISSHNYHHPNNLNNYQNYYRHNNRSNYQNYYYSVSHRPNITNSFHDDMKSIISINQLPIIESLRIQIQQPFVSYFIPTQTHLKHLELSKCIDLTDNDIAIIIEWCKKLDSIILRQCPKFTDRSIITIAKNIPNLNHLRLMEFPHISHSSIIAISDNCRSLKTFELSITTAAIVRFDELSIKPIIKAPFNSSFIRLLQNCDKLIELSLELPGSFGNQILNSLGIKGHKSLKILKYSRIPNEYCDELLDSKFINMLSNGCENLRVFNLKVELSKTNLDVSN
ncbi:3390_t:CDS:1 [Cetraspora pellucida]|uniref:3390_t:CDS:1 n=1 Tax=Cetraspora pellucida TaxID=1433469 RepID=A0A9N9EQH3_9GLOM|nr:3390_t:CDS:1 [Cetraspora pellucida]